MTSATFGHSLIQLFSDDDHEFEASSAVKRSSFKARMIYEGRSRPNSHLFDDQNCFARQPKLLLIPKLVLQFQTSITHTTAASLEQKSTQKCRKV